MKDWEVNPPPNLAGRNGCVSELQCLGSEVTHLHNSLFLSFQKNVGKEDLGKSVLSHVTRSKNKTLQRK